MDVLISITGTQRVDGEEETIELTTAGGMEPAGEGWTLTYDESAATGMEGVTTTGCIRMRCCWNGPAACIPSSSCKRGAAISAAMPPLTGRCCSGCIRASCAVP